MKLESILITNFKSLFDINIKFDNNIKLLCGKNNTGKSTILEAISMVLSSNIDDRVLKDKVNIFQRNNSF